MDTHVRSKAPSTLWLLSDAGGGTFNQYGQFLTPRMIWHERVERARELLGLADDSHTAPEDEQDGSFLPVVMAVSVVIIMGIVGVIVLAARRRAHTEPAQGT